MEQEQTGQAIARNREYKVYGEASRFLDGPVSCEVICEIIDDGEVIGKVSSGDAISTFHKLAVYAGRNAAERYPPTCNPDYSRITTIDKVVRSESGMNAYEERPLDGCAIGNFRYGLREGSRK